MKNQEKYKQESYLTILINNHEARSEQLQGGKNSADCSVKVLIS